MKYRSWLSLALAFAAAPPVISAAKDQELPDKDMLKMIEFLREMEMLKQIDMMRNLDRVDGAANQGRNLPAAKSAPATKKETPK